MTPLIEKYFKKEQIEHILNRIKLDKALYNEFIFFIEDSLKGIEDEDPSEEEFSKKFTLDSAEKFAVLFMQKLSEGYSYPWSKQYASLMCYNEKDRLLGYCYEAACNADPVQAENDLLLYCKLKNADKLFTDYFVEWMKEGEGFSDPDAEEQAEEFSETYKKQKEKGKSDVYAYQYANLSAMFDYHEIYIEEYAYIYDKSISEGKDDDYARTYAEKYASELVDIKRRAGISDDEEMLEFAKLKALAFIKGWDYARKNIHKDIHTFIEIFENKYMNLYYADGDDAQLSIKEIEKLALERAVEQYNVYLGRKK